MKSGGESSEWRGRTSEMCGPEQNNIPKHLHTGNLLLQSSAPQNADLQTLHTKAGRGISLKNP